MTTCYTVTDYVQDEFNDNSKYSLISDGIIVLGLGFFYYKHGDFELLAKLFAIAILIRFILSFLTNIQNSETKKHHYQLNGQLSLLLIIIYILYSQKLFDINEYVLYSIIALYIFLIITTKSSTTSDALFTSLVVYAIVTLTTGSSLYKPIMAASSI